MSAIRKRLTVAACLPSDHGRAQLVGRAWLPDAAGPAVVLVTADGVFDLSHVASTMTGLLDLRDAAAAVRGAGALPRIGDTAKLLANSATEGRDEHAPWLLAPCDLASIKAAGVTFVSSMLERVIEEQARGDPAKAESVRKAVVAIIGDDLSRVRPGSAEAARLKDALIAQGVWSQYLEVGIGPDAEIFTKAQPMSTCAISRGAARFFSARRRTTTRRARSARSCGCSTTDSGSTTCVAASLRCGSTDRKGSCSTATARCR